MASSTEAREFRSRIERVESLIREVEQFSDPECALAAARTSQDRHRAARRAPSSDILETAADTPECGRRIDRFVRRR